MQQNLLATDYDADWKANPGAKEARFKVNQLDDGILVPTNSLAGKNRNPVMDQALKDIHGYIQGHLTELEDPSQKDFRGKQPQVIIHCFSGMPWSMALVAYDAVRAYEDKYVDVSTWRPEDWSNPDKSRDVSFAPPRLRAYRELELGFELKEIIHTN